MTKKKDVDDDNILKHCSLVIRFTSLKKKKKKKSVLVKQQQVLFHRHHTLSLLLKQAGHVSSRLAKPHSTHINIYTHKHIMYTRPSVCADVDKY